MLYMYNHMYRNAFKLTNHKNQVLTLPSHKGCCSRPIVDVKMSIERYWHNKKKTLKDLSLAQIPPEWQK